MKKSLKKRATLITSFAIVITLFSGVNAAAQSALNGREVMSRVFDRQQPTDIRSTLEMILRTKRGDERSRNALQIIGNFDGVQKKILFITAPALVRNTAFMNFSYDGNENEQWIYLPAFGSVRAISSSGGNEGFMGSDFAFDDMVQRHPSRDVHTVIRKETLKGREFYVVESVFPDDDSAYGRTVTWVADDIWIGLRREFYDAKEVLVKTLEVDELEQTGSFWTITEMTMTTLKSGHSTTMKLSDLTINSGLTEDYFSEERMKIGIE
mgnify:CR=1 FL=1|jgi:outer membrane lipoprotein-sorting protein